MNDKFNQEIFKAIAKSKNKHTQQTNVDSVLDHIIKTTGNQRISKAFLKDKIETLVNDGMLKNKPGLEKKKPYYLTKKVSRAKFNSFETRMREI